MSFQSELQEIIRIEVKNIVEEEREALFRLIEVKMNEWLNGAKRKNMEQVLELTNLFLCLF